jgi:murein DD-endopeptidase MepM/ murein hydrolase activator NlpD
VKLQWHPSSGRRTVFSLEVEGVPATLLTAALAAVALLWLILPLSLGAVLERWRRGRAEAEVAVLNARRHEALELATSALRLSGERLAADRERLARIAYLYGLAALARRVAAPRPPRATADSALDASEREVASLSEAVGTIEQFERRHPETPPRTPSILPVPESASVAIGQFGWRVSRLTGRTEFSPGIDFAAPKGSAVVATADGTVRWAGPAVFRDSGSYRRYGRIVAIRHGDHVTVYGNLETVGVVRGARVRRGERIGTVGESPWFGAPRARYEVWRLSEGEPAPVDPRLAVLGNRSAAGLEEIRRSPRPAARAETVLPAEFR